MAVFVLDRTKTAFLGPFVGPPKLQKPRSDKYFREPLANHVHPEVGNITHFRVFRSSRNANALTRRGPECARPDSSTSSEEFGEVGGLRKP